MLSLYFSGVQLVMSNDQLYKDHVEEWTNLWQSGRIDVSNNMKLAKALYGSIYYILSSLPLDSDPQWPYIGLSPTGLPFGDSEHAKLVSIANKVCQMSLWWRENCLIIPLSLAASSRNQCVSLVCPSVHKFLCHLVFPRYWSYRFKIWCICYPQSVDVHWHVFRTSWPLP